MLALDTGSSIFGQLILRENYKEMSKKNYFCSNFDNKTEKIIDFLISSKFSRIMDSTQSTRTDSIKFEC